MNLINYIKREYIVYPLKGGKLEDVLTEMISVFKNKRIRKRQDTIIKELINMEREFGTVIGESAALPHLRMKKLDDIYLSVGLSANGIKLDGEEEPVYLIFLELSPQRLTELHLRIMGEIARLVKNISLPNILSSVVTSDQLYSKLIEAYHSLEGR